MTLDTTSQRRYLVRAINAPIHAAAFAPCADDGLTTALHHTTRYAQLIIPKRLVTHPFAIGAEVAERLLRHVIRFTMIGYRVQQRFDVAQFQQPDLCLRPLPGQVLLLSVD